MAMVVKADIEVIKIIVTKKTMAIAMIILTTDAVTMITTMIIAADILSVEPSKMKLLTIMIYLMWK